MWKTKRLSATVLRAATGVNRWIISLNANPEVEIEVSAGRMKFVAVTTPNNDLNNNNDNIHEEPVSEPETNISSESEKEEEEVNVNNNNELLWTDAAVIIDSCRVFRSYSNVTVVHISDIEHATPRQFFERFLPIGYIMSTVLLSTNTRARASERYWKDLTWMEFMKFIGILTIMTYVRCADICDYWSIEQKTGGVSLGFDTPIDDNDPFYFAQKFHNEFNENLAKAITPGSPFQRKIPRKPHPIGCEFKTMADARTNLFLQLDPVEPPEYSSKKKFAEHSATIATMLRLTEPWFSSGRTIIADSWFDALESDYGSFISRVGKFDDVDLTLCSLRDRKNTVLLASCSTTNLKNEVTRYIKGHGNVKFHRPAVFDEYNEYRSAIDILNNLCDNALSYHDVLTTKCSENRILAFYFSVAEANSYSAYCQFVPGKKNMKHVDFRKQLVISIFDYYSEDETVSNRTKKQKRKDSNDIEHNLINIKDDSSSSQLKGKRIQRRCISCHKCTTTGCKCSMPQAMFSNCWANHIRNTYNPIRTG
ncbi:hypothetical protein Glove_109g106 [Diversispora epigaea]|uniref:PiggyBac transposable element-derived protein domain-containing protein n=1 Tax=Diversispora epigaea TaxID=1348612 RepID=A0A397JBS8_9GLOM|nr:hypothetical protein Glove_109g106 [Diversispora epigaea]